MPVILKVVAEGVNSPSSFPTTSDPTFTGLGFTSATLVVLLTGATVSGGIKRKVSTVVP